MIAGASFDAHLYLNYNDVIMSEMASQITSLTIVYSSVYSGADQRKHQSSVSLAFVILLDILMLLSHLKSVPHVTLVDAIVGSGTLIYGMCGEFIGDRWIPHPKD